MYISMCVYMYVYIYIYIYVCLCVIRTPAPKVQPSEGQLGPCVRSPYEASLAGAGGEAPPGERAPSWPQQPPLPPQYPCQWAGEEWENKVSSWQSLLFTVVQKLGSHSSSWLLVISVMTAWLLCMSVQVNPDYDSTFEFENDFPALQPDAPDPGERM